MFLLGNIAGTLEYLPVSAAHVLGICDDDDGNDGGGDVNVGESPDDVWTSCRSWMITLSI